MLLVKMNYWIFTYVKINIVNLINAKAVNKKPTKLRTNKYDEKLAIKGTFAQVFQVVKKNKEEKKKI
jgi:hypothetical protein